MSDEQRPVSPPEADESRLEEQLHALFREAYPEEPTSPEFQTRVLARLRAEEAARQRPPRRRRALRLAFALAVLVLAVLGLNLLAPRHVEAELFEDLETALRSVQSAHFVRWRIGPGEERTRIHEIWFQAGRWRVESGSQTQIFTDGTLWRWEAERNRWTRETRESLFTQSPAGLSPAAVVHSFLRAGQRKGVRRLGTEPGQGRTLQLFAIEQTGLDARTVVAIDPKTHLPAWWSSQQQAGTQWVNREITEAEFGQPLSSELFRPTLPPAEQ